MPFPVEGGRRETVDRVVSALDAWCEWWAMPAESKGGAPVGQLEEASQAMRDLRKSQRDGLLEALAGGRARPVDANARLDAVRWLDGAVYHAWRLADSLDQAMGGS
jgi:phosphate:Na+ symporter